MLTGLAGTSVLARHGSLGTTATIIGVVLVVFVAGLWLYVHLKR